MRDFRPGFDDATSRGFSASLWQKFTDLGDFQNNPSNGYFFFDDFMDFPLPGTQTSEITLGRYKVFSSTAGVVRTDTMPHTANTLSGQGGIISMLGDTAGDQSSIATQACPFSLAATAGRLWFEARIATSSIATDMTHIFVGLGNNCETTLSVAIPLADANATGTAVNLIGITRLEDGLGVLNGSYTDEAAVYTHAATGIGAIAANTWVKVGFTFDPSRGARCIEFYVNGVKSSTAISATTLAALTNLDACPLGLVMAQFTDANGTANYAYLDWWACAQEAV